MAQVNDGMTVNLLPVMDELDSNKLRQAAILAELEELQERSTLLEAILELGRTQAASADNSSAAENLSGAGTSGAAAQLAGQGGRRARDVILRVFHALPAGTQLKTAELHARMRDDYGYKAPAETARKSAQRMSARGALVKVGPGLWRLPDGPPGGPVES